MTSVTFLSVYAVLNTDRRISLSRSNEAGLSQPCFMDREACGAHRLGDRGHAARQRGAEHSRAKVVGAVEASTPLTRQARGRQAGEPSRFSALYPELFSGFPNWAYTIFFIINNNSFVFLEGKKLLIEN